MNGIVDLRAAQAQSGEWHILGPRGCLAVEADRISADSVRRIQDDKRRREWCSYCERELRIVELERQGDRLESVLEATDPTGYVAPVRSRKDKVWHANPECSHGVDDPTPKPLSEVREDGFSACKFCVLEVEQPEEQDHSQYQRLVDADPGGEA